MATIEKTGNNRVKLTVEIGKEAFSASLQQAYIKTRARYNVPGFRKGKAPRKVIENLNGEGVFFEDAFEDLYPEAYENAIAEHGLEPVDRPDVTIESIGAESGATFSAEVYVKPEVTLGSYKGIEVVGREYTVKDVQVDGFLEQEREKLSRFIEVDRPIEQGDYVLLDYCGRIDDEPFEGGTAEDYKIEVGSKTFVPGFEEQLIGLVKGEEKNLEIRFPDDYHSEKLKGKDVVFAVKINGIQKKELPELDDEFAKDISEFNTLEDLREDKRKALEKNNEERARLEVENSVVTKTVENASIDVPDVMTEREVNNMLRNISYRLSMSGLSMEDYLKYSGIDIEVLRKSYRPEALKRVRTQLVLEAISKAEGIEALEEELSETIAEHAAHEKKTPEEFRAMLKDEDLEYFKDTIITRKTIAFITDNALIIGKFEALNRIRKYAKCGCLKYVSKGLHLRNRSRPARA